jgi:LysR family glycine cleavage system transcriptional activator
MAPTLPPLGWLRTFEAAARHLSFTGAARDLNMTQSAVSQQIKALEAHLGQRLFHRHPRALALTEAGTAYLPMVRDAFRTLRAGTAAVMVPDRNVVQIHANLSFALHWMVPRLPRFQAAHPEVRLSLTTEIWEPREIAEGADVEIRYSVRPSDTVRADLLWSADFYPVCAPAYQVELADLSRHPLFNCSNVLCTWERWAEAQGLDWPDPFVTLSITFVISLAAAMAGAGLALGNDLILRDLIREGRLHAPFDGRAPMQEAYYLILAPQAERNPGAVAFANWLRAELARDRAAG